MLTLAFEIGLQPAQFWDLTLLEFRKAVDAHVRVVKRQHRMLAWVQVNLMNCWRGKGQPRVTVNKLMGAKSFEPGTTKKEIDEHYRSKKKKKRG
jgi:hypothetical protein